MCFKERLRDETIETIDKLNELNAFMATKTFYNLSRVEKDLLYEQVRTLNILVQILGKRCEFYEITLDKHFNKEERENG